MRIHIDIDENLLQEVQKLGHFTTKKAIVTCALTEYAKLLKRQQLLTLRGKVKWEGDLKILRQNRNYHPNDTN